MDKRQKEIMSALVGRLRHILVGSPTDHGFEPGDLDRELERLGVDREGVVTPMDAMADTHHNGDGLAYRVASTLLNRLPENRRRAARREIVERAAYTWINRLLALRALEVRELIYETLRSNPDPDYSGVSERLYLLRMDERAIVTEPDGGWWRVLNKACVQLAPALPGLFAANDPDAALHPTPGALIQCIELIGGKQPVLSSVSVEELDDTFKDPDAIGWAYQFYQAEAKGAIDAICKAGGKAASRSELAAKTQIFTEPYMVQWLLQNSLGRSYVEAYPQSTLPAQWPYYIQPEPASAQPERVFPLEELTLLDPCMGSGHFLRAAFDLFVAMYREQQSEMSALQIANRILGQHLFGIDLDPRAKQLSELTLYLRAWELVKAEQRSGDMTIYRSPEMHLATTPTNLDRGALERHIQRYPEDVVYRPLLEKVFEGLEQADTLGSLLRSREYLDQAIRDLQMPHTVEMAFTQVAEDLRRDVTELAHGDERQLRQLLLDRIASSFRSEATATDDVSMALFGREAERGVRLLQVLDGQYAVVVTNPPYLGSAYMDEPLRRYMATHYKAGKRDLSAAFILRCLQLSKPGGRVAMITQHSWMFLGSYEGIRHQLVTDYKLSTLAHLGTKTFKDLSNTNAIGFVLFTIHCQHTTVEDVIICLRLVHAQLKEPALQEITAAFRSNSQPDERSSFIVPNEIFQKIPGNILFYWSPTGITEAFLAYRTLSSIVDARQGLITGDNDRFLRFWWEVSRSSWKPYAKGGSFRRWFGNQELVVDWDQNGIRIKELKTPTGKQKSRPQNISYYFREGGTWTAQSSYGFSVRYLPKDFIFAAKGPSFFVKSKDTSLASMIAIANSKLIQFVFSAIEPTVDYGEGYFMSLPAPIVEFSRDLLTTLAEKVIEIKRHQMKGVSTERCFDMSFSGYFASHRLMMGKILSVDVLIHSIEGLNDEIVCNLYNLTRKDVNAIMGEIGTPAGWYPLITGYDSLPDLSEELEDLPELPQELYNHLAMHERINPNAKDLVRIKESLRPLYKAGQRVKDTKVEEGEEDSENKSDDETESDTHIPTETFLEELSVKMQLHPISVYWLLEELRTTEMVRCLPEERRLLEDRLSVLVLRLLGHRWPKQIEAFEPVPEWAERDGIIPLVAGTGHRELAERVRERLFVEEGALGAQEVERLLQELTEEKLEQWLRGTFFERHASQFKKRPVVWHLASTPPKRGAGGDKKKRGESLGPRTPAFECMLYYHACSGDALARIRTQYVEPLLQAERGNIDSTSIFQDGSAAGESATLFADDLATVHALERIRELEEFVKRLRDIEESGFACKELSEIVAEEVLDRWSGDGYNPPRDQEAFQRGEQAWRVDINDGVRVNIAPLQLAGVLAREVLNPKDAKKALGDRVRWRADERRWVREDKLPRCGWLDERVPANPNWNEHAASRAPGKRGQQPELLPQETGENEKEVRS